MKLITDSMALRSRARTCAVTGRGNDKEGFFDTHRILPGWDQEVHVAVAAVREMARQIGLVDAEAVAELEAEIEAFGEKVAEVRELADQIEEFLELAEEADEEEAD